MHRRGADVSDVFWKSRGTGWMGGMWEALAISVVSSWVKEYGWGG